MNKKVIVVNSDFSPISVITWKRAINLILKGRAEIVEKSEEVIKNFEGTVQFILPKVIKLVNFVKHVFKARISFTRKNVIIRDRHTCQYCNAKENLSIDHVIPYAKGGTSTWHNCVAACAKCNHLKGSRSLKECGLTLKIKPKEPTLTEFIKAKIETLNIQSQFTF